MRYTYLLARREDTLSGLAAAYGVTEDALRAANGLAPSEPLRTGQMLKVPAAVAGPSVAPGAATLGGAVVTRGEPARRLIALTFEASFGKGATAAILKELRHAGVRSTWFLGGAWAEKHPRLAREVAAAGHQTECHAYSHPHLRELDATQMREELLRGLAAVAAAAGRKPQLLRPPFGAHNRTLLQVASKLGLGVVLWTFDSLDWQSPGAQYVADRIVGLAQPGAIVGMHASADQAPAALRLAIPRLRAAGYGFATLDDLLRQGRQHPGNARRAANPLR